MRKDGWIVFNSKYQSQGTEQYKDIDRIESKKGSLKIIKNGEVIGTVNKGIVQEYDVIEKSSGLG